MATGITCRERRRAESPRSLRRHPARRESHPTGKRRTPSYQRHKATGQAYVVLDDQTHYLGEHGGQESLERYRELVTGWLARQSMPARQRSITIGELTLRYHEHAQAYYRKNGEVTSEVSGIRAALAHLNDLYSDLPVSDFGPLHLKAVRERLVEAGYYRTGVNKRIQRMVRMFAWGVENELVPITVYQALRTVTGLRKGRTEAPETEPVQPVPEEDVNAVLPIVAPQIRDMIRLQLLSGCRPHEICDLRPGDLL